MACIVSSSQWVGGWQTPSPKLSSNRPDWRAELCWQVEHCAVAKTASASRRAKRPSCSLSTPTGTLCAITPARTLSCFSGGTPASSSACPSWIWRWVRALQQFGLPAKSRRGFLLVALVAHQHALGRVRFLGMRHGGAVVVFDGGERL